MAGADLLPPYWVEPDKHRPPHRNSITWAEVRRQTDEDEKVAKYHFDIGLPQIKRIEMAFHTGDSKLWVSGGLQECEMVVEQLRQGDPYLYFVTLADEDFVVGASRGEDTNIVLVKRARCGPVHGQPINADELRKLKRKWNYGTS